MTDLNLTEGYQSFIEDIKSRILSSRYQAARAVNKELILLYYHIGKQILEKQKAQGWGAKVIEHLSKDLKSNFPEMKGFSSRNLKYMRQFAELYPDIEFVQQAVAQLPWGHNVYLMNFVQDKEARSFYIKKAIEHDWSRTVMELHIESNLYHRQGKAVTNFKEKLPSSVSDRANYTLRDPYIFDFLTLHDSAVEREIEKELVKHIEKFLLELGSGFAFVGRQYKLNVSDQLFYIDLLFYHLTLRSFIVIELKNTAFKPEYVGQVNFYLSAIDDQVKHPDDGPTIGLILCKTKSNIIAEYALRDVNSPIGIAEFRTTGGLPENIKTALPSIEQIEFELSKHLKAAEVQNQNSDHSKSEEK
ncbi:MAG: PDDEXK nuclease domain-containing protein [Alphaproteobacteria bacterium]|nr:PDDEXK nuclease domain-containing protein [Alphaproteobacteria bacterium]